MLAGADAMAELGAEAVKRRLAKDEHVCAVGAPPLPPDMDGAAFGAHERADERARCFSVKIVSIQLSRGVIGLERLGRLRRRHALLFVLRCAAEALHCVRSSCRALSHRIVLGFGDKCTEHKMDERRASIRQSELSGCSNNRVEHAIRRLWLSGHAFLAEDYPTH